MKLWKKASGNILIILVARYVVYMGTDTGRSNKKVDSIIQLWHFWGQIHEISTVANNMNVLEQLIFHNFQKT